ncbi:vitelline membrane protein Vm32E-like [Stomoxys calcitrans]|uniref:vitelline membrane protein Vm32E-like n=1 Tax=Stomoxys calcitrans TaxID=35570 RepID=UPI0027E2729C|nr:vitelline membrane protein Vm32E-like [Stomoxys calcitrans]
MNFVGVLLALVALFTVVSAGGYGGGGAVHIPAPPCPKNYMFSCQPNLSPAPCAQPAAAYGSAGSYSENYPTIVNPPFPGQHGAGYQQFNNGPNYPNFYIQGGPSN